MGRLRGWPLAIGLVGTGVVAGTTFLLLMSGQSSADLRPADPTAAAAELDAVRARFVAARPYVELVSRGEGFATFVHHDLEPVAPASISRLGVKAWRAEERQLVDLTVPYWAFTLTRWKVDATLALASPMLPGVELPDLDRLGPGLVLDHRDAAGNRVLLWTE